MADTMQIQIGVEGSQALRDLADLLKTSPERAAQEAVSSGIHALQRFAFYVKRSGSVTPEAALDILRRAGKGALPEPGDELPDRFTAAL